MSLADLASLGSFISGIAVLVSLVYLAQQIRQSTKHSRAAISHGFATRTVDFNYRMTDEKLATAIVKGRSASAELTEVEIFQFMAYTRAAFWNASDTFVQYRNGLVDEAVFASFERAQVGLMQAPGMQIAWSFMRDAFAPNFVAFMDRIAADASARGDLDFSAAWSTAIAAGRVPPNKV